MPCRGYSLMNTAPTSNFRAIFLILESSVPNIEASKPNLDEFARLIASSSSATLISKVTGPKASS